MTFPSVSDEAVPAAFLEPVAKLSRDLAAAAASMTVEEVRFMVKAYYDMQEDRIRTAHQAHTKDEADAPHEIMTWLTGQHSTLEKQVARALDRYSASRELGRWARSICGIGPIIAAGLMAHIDINKAPTVGHIWRYAGLDPTVKWGKGEKRPWNSDLKVLCWKLGESFVKVSGNDNDVYGKVYKARKLEEVARNEAGAFADQAATSLTEKKFGKDTEAFKHYSVGRLPPARIQLRAQRYAVKLFLSHYHHVAHEIEFNLPPPKPYILAHGEGHVHYLGPPNWPMVEG